MVCVKVLRCPALGLKDLKKLLVKLKQQCVSPIRHKIAKMENHRTVLMCNRTNMPIIDRKALVFFPLQPSFG